MEGIGLHVLYDQLLTGENAASHPTATTEDKASDSSVAVLRLPSNVFPTSEAESRYVFEVASASQLCHPNIVAIHCVHQVGDTTCVEMERVVGVSLEEVLHHVRTDGPPPIEVVVSLVAELAEALAHAHERGVAHGDLRPCHLIIDAAGNLRLLGFGMARLAEQPGHSCYAAPEVLRGAPADARADLYSLGVIAYELVTGQPLFDEHMAAELRRYLAARVRLPSTCNPDCPREMDELLLGALAIDPEDRWATTADLCRAIEGIGGTSPAAVSAWLDRSVSCMQAPQSRTVPPPIPGDALQPPRRLARGTGRLPSESEVIAISDGAEATFEPEEDIHEEETVIREITPQPERELRLPLEPPSGAYAALDVVDDEAESVSSAERAIDAPLLPTFGTTSWDDGEQALWPMPESRALARCLDIAIAFVAGAASTYLLLTWLG